jgi:hypothetical protein
MKMVLSCQGNQKVAIVFTHVSLKKATVFLTLKIDEDYEFNLVMNDQRTNG